MAASLHREGRFWPIKLLPDTLLNCMFQARKVSVHVFVCQCIDFASVSRSCICVSVSTLPLFLVRVFVCQCIDFASVSRSCICVSVYIHVVSVSRSCICVSVYIHFVSVSRSCICVSVYPLCLCFSFVYLCVSVYPEADFRGGVRGVRPTP